VVGHVLVVFNYFFPNLRNKRLADPRNMKSKWCGLSTTNPSKSSKNLPRYTSNRWIRPRVYIP
jgi:hypothetical protein